MIAVSGGVDSMALLDLLQGKAGLRLVVAHLDHGIREDSMEDRRLVHETARRYGLPFVYQEARLGAGASEAEARTVRYRFLRQTARASGARAIITAHHQDDLLETAIINLLRGTGRKGLTSLSSRHDMERPLLGVAKRDLQTYARDQGLVWREDSTNNDDVYLRNYVRHQLLPRFDDRTRDEFVSILTNLTITNRAVDDALTSQLHSQSQAGCLDRRWFNSLPHAVAREVLAAWLRAHEVRGFDRRTLERLVVAAKVAAPGRSFPVLAGSSLRVSSDSLALTGAER